MHGGAAGSGAPLGNENAFVHGDYSRRVKEEIRKSKELMRAAMKALKDLELDD
jgi:hypothetical protein